jgi:allantoin racemase
MRIWYQSMTELHRLPGYASVLAEHVRSASTRDVQVDVVGLSDGTYEGKAPMEVLRYPLGFHRALSQVLENVVQAEAVGYDAFLMGSFVAPFLREARCAVDIAVTSMAESVLLTARSFSRRLALICISEDQVGTATDLVAALGLGDWVRCFVAIDEVATEVVVSDALTGSAGALADSFRRACGSAVEAGADLIVPAEGILSEMARLRGITAVGGVAVLDSVEIALAHTAMVSGLLASGAIGVGRRKTYPKEVGDAISPRAQLGRGDVQ